MGAIGAAGLMGSRSTAATPKDPFYRGDAEPAKAVNRVGRTLQTEDSAVARENTRVGAAGFTIMGHRFADDERGQIAGYVSETSVEPGRSLNFHVSVKPAQQYRIQVYRIGYYGGAGARLVTASPWLDGGTQEAPSVQTATRMVGCNWPVSWQLVVGSDWVSGLYMALLNNSAGWCQWVPFVVRAPGRATAGLVVLPTSTYQAYNRWPAVGHTGASLYYGFDSAGRLASDLRAAAVSHRRPYSAAGLPHFIQDEIGFVRWSEQHGDNVSYAASEDLDTGRINPSRYRAVIFCGHDEYWSIPMRRSVAAARDDGTSVLFLSANNCYWRVRYGESNGQPDEGIISCSKVVPRRGKAELMCQWRKAGSPEQHLLGAQYVSMVDGNAPLVVRNSRHWLWAGTGARDGDKIPNVVRGEADQVMSDVALPRSTEHSVLASSPYTRLGDTHLQNTSLYRAPSGAWVFAAGTMGWTGALYADRFVDTRIQRATRNLLDRVLLEPS